MNEEDICSYYDAVIKDKNVTKNPGRRYHNHCFLWIPFLASPGTKAQKAEL